ncbi:MAG: SWIM zinc finger family protein [Verrucomicrobiota bacterium]
MISIDDSYVDSVATNASAIKNGRKLVSKRKFFDLSLGEDERIVFGKCSGSGSNPYECSVDFLDSSQPIYRCSCPSRQFPCKHCLGLLYAWVDNPGSFSKASLPEDLAEKRGKAEKRAAKKKASAGKPKAPRKVNKTALKKKLAAQLEALDLLENLLRDMLHQGMGSHGQKEAAGLAEKAAQLRAAYLPGAELAILRLSSTISSASASRHRGGENRSLYFQAMDELARLEALIRRGRTYLAARSEDPDLKPEVDSDIAAWLGHAWRYEELQEAGLGEGDAEFLQLAFFIRDDTVKREYADTGIWFHLGDSRLFFSETLRPYRATGHIKGDDSVFSVACVPDFVRYPGEMPVRMRWQAMEPRAPRREDFAAIRSVAATEFQPVMKKIRANLKLPLGPRFPIALLLPKKIGRVGEGIHAPFVIEDGDGTRIELANVPESLHGIPPTCQLMPLLGNHLDDAPLLCLFHLDFETLRLTAQPLTFLHEDRLTRLAY